jgi:hypothetical protein
LFCEQRRTIVIVVSTPVDRNGASFVFIFLARNNRQAEAPHREQGTRATGEMDVRNNSHRVRFA